MSSMFFATTRVSAGVAAAAGAAVASQRQLAAAAALSILIIAASIGRSFLGRVAVSAAPSEAARKQRHSAASPLRDREARLSGLSGRETQAKVAESEAGMAKRKDQTRVQIGRAHV